MLLKLMKKSSTRQHAFVQFQKELSVLLPSRTQTTGLRRTRRIGKARFERMCENTSVYYFTLNSVTTMSSTQTVTDFSRQACVALPDARVNTIELIPIGPVPDKLLELLQMWQEAFFGCRCQIGNPIRVRAVAKGMREGARRQLQLRCGTIFDKIKRRKVAPNVMLRVGVTMVDLFPDEDWNFV